MGGKLAETYDILISNIKGSWQLAVSGISWVFILCPVLVSVH